MQKKLDISKYQSLSQRLQALVDHFCNGVVLKFSKDLGITSTTFAEYLKESGEHKIRFLTFQKILENYPEVSPAWLLTGEGEMLRGAAPAGEPATDPAQTAFEREILTLEQTLRRANASDETIQRAILARVGATPPSRYPVAGEDQTEIRATDGPPAVHES